jgi:hypothetical protein
LFVSYTFYTLTKEVMTKSKMIAFLFINNPFDSFK